MFGYQLAMQHDGGKKKYEKNAFYPTPDDGTVQAMLNYIGNPWKGLTVWEPCAGRGDISKVVERNGMYVVNSDIETYGVELNHFEQKSFFDYEKPRADVLITNPPYNVDHKFVTHALDLGIRDMALLLKVSFFSSQAGFRVFNYVDKLGNGVRPAYVMPLNWRPDWKGEGSPHLNVMWVVWQRDSKTTEFDILDMPLEYKAKVKAERKLKREQNRRNKVVRGRHDDANGALSKGESEGR